MAHPPAREVNFDGLIGPTHNYAGLSRGNVASASHAGRTSHPRAAALQGLAKMRTLMDLGLTQGVLPPHPRPDLGFLRRIGFAGDDAAVLRAAHDADPALLAASWSASAMWCANAATVSPSADTGDGRVHITPANLVSNLHRSIEHPFTTRLLRAVFHDEDRFVVHDALPDQARFADEGAANHIRFATEHGAPGVELFVYGVDAHDPALSTRRYPSRQTRAACEAIVRTHRLDPSRVVLARQHPDAIDAGVFHNDVISSGNLRVFLSHEQAFATPRSLHSDIAAPLGADLVSIEAHDTDFPIEDAVSSYLFNSQIVSRDNGSMTLVAPVESREHTRVAAFVDRVVGDPANPIDEVRYLDVRESMHNGGGPACLRLRVVLRDDELARVHPGVILDEALHNRLCAFIEREYPQSLSPEDLLDPELAARSVSIVGALCDLLGLGGVLGRPDPSPIGARSP